MARRTAPELAEGIRYLQRHPATFGEKAFGDEYWSVQRAILDSLVANEKTAVASCHSIGKTFIASRAVLWFMHLFAPAIVATTAPTAHQVRNLLWKEIRTAHATLPVELRGESRCLTTELQFLTADKQVRPEHIAWGRSTNDPAQFQGVHGEYLLAVVDEAAGVDDAIYEALDTWGAGGMYRELLIGNPTHSEGKFHRAFHNPELGYQCIRVPVTDTPNWTGEAVPARVRRLLVQPERVEAWKADWGEGSAAFRARVFAEFPAAGEHEVIVPLGWVYGAQVRGAEWQAGEDEDLQVGVDVARFGEDRTSVASRVGMALTALTSAPGDTTAPQVAAMAAEAAIALRDRYGREVLVVIDETGVGGGALDICRTRDDRDITYVGFNFGGVARDSERRSNAGAEAYWNLRDYMQTGNDCADLVIAAEGREVERFAAQVSARRYDYDAKGRIRLERKEDMKKRGLPSPDEADAVAMAFAPMVAPSEPWSFVA